MPSPKYGLPRQCSTKKKSCPQAFWKSDFTFTGFLWGLIVSGHLETGFPKLVVFSLCLAWLISLWGCYKSVFCVCYRSGNTDFLFLLQVCAPTAFSKSQGVAESPVWPDLREISPWSREHLACVPVWPEGHQKYFKLFTAWYNQMHSFKERKSAEEEICAAKIILHKIILTFFPPLFILQHLQSVISRLIGFICINGFLAMQSTSRGCIQDPGRMLLTKYEFLLRNTSIVLLLAFFVSLSKSED